jgi:hypothetical protein
MTGERKRYNKIIIYSAWCGLVVTRAGVLFLSETVKSSCSRVYTIVEKKKKSPTTSATVDACYRSRSFLRVRAYVTRKMEARGACAPVRPSSGWRWSTVGGTSEDGVRAAGKTTGGREQIRKSRRARQVYARCHIICPPRPPTTDDAVDRSSTTRCSPPEPDRLSARIRMPTTQNIITDIICTCVRVRLHESNLLPVVEHHHKGMACTANNTYYLCNVYVLMLCTVLYFKDQTELQIFSGDRRRTGPHLNVNQTPKLNRTDGFILFLDRTGLEII